MNELHKLVRKLTYIFLLIGIIIAYYFFTSLNIITQYVKNPLLLKEIVLRWEILAPLAIILLQTFQAIISIFPSQVTTVAAGFIFGPILGTLYSLIGSFLGSLTIFLLSRKFGEKIATKIFNKKEIHHYHTFFRQRKRWALFTARIIPILPNDMVSMAAGMTNITLKNFNIISTLGFAVQMIILTYFGSQLAIGSLNIQLLIILIIVVLLVLIAVFHSQLKQVLIKDVYKIEKKIEKEIIT